MSRNLATILLVMVIGMWVVSVRHGANRSTAALEDDLPVDRSVECRWATDPINIDGQADEQSEGDHEAESCARLLALASQLRVPPRAVVVVSAVDRLGVDQRGWRGSGSHAGRRCVVPPRGTRLTVLRRAAAEQGSVRQRAVSVMPCKCDTRLPVPVCTAMPSWLTAGSTCCTPRH